MTERAREIAVNLATFRDRLTRACDRAGRDPAGVTLIAVTKTFPVEDARVLADLGVTDFGENRDAEAKVKAAALPDVRWHFIGQLQRNKARSVARYAAVVHSVDRLELVEALDRGAAAAGRDLDVLVQVALEEPPRPDRGGVAPLDLPELAATVADADRLRLRGLMAIAPLGADPDEAFARLARLAGQVRAEWPDAGVLSAGMSGDLESAVKYGATHVRVGTALLGRRTYLVG
ncbi:MAG: YggS family pyridoxal phosphate-dependent enzyme [Mycobacteriales bacterium]